MDWRDFERLCARLIEASYGHVTQAFRYGSFPQSQGGIDIVATSPSSRKRIVAECKRVQKLGAGDIAAWTNRFMTGTELSSVERFILAITADVESSNKRVDEWTQFLERAAARGIVCELWDYSRIEELLRSRPELVCMFFGAEAAKRFCMRVDLASRWPSEFRARHKQHDPERHFLTLEDRFVQLSLFVPSQYSPFVSAGLSFARQDLRGLSLAIESKTIVSWMQWIANAGRDASVPFIRKDAAGNGWILQAPNARLRLEASEVVALKWVLEQGWATYIESARTLDRVWRASRFPRGDGESTFNVQLYSMDVSWWNACVEYMHEYDASHGGSAAHIYDAVRGMLKVYVPQSRAGLESGYHLIAPVDRDNTSLWSDDVILHWTPISLTQDERFSYSPQRAWDAEHSHDWIGDIFRSRVLEYARHKRGSVWKALNASSDRESMMHSRACLPFSGESLRLVSRDELRALVVSLQRHFHGYPSDVPVRRECVRSALSATSRLLLKIDHPDEHYIRSKLDLPQGSLVVGIETLIVDRARESSSSFELDLALRCLLSVAEDLREISTSELDWLARCLQWVWSRIREDRLCWTYR